DLGWITEAKPFSVDQNLWGRTIEAGVLEDPWLQPPEEAFEWTVAPGTAGGSREVEVGFRAGVAATLDGEEAGVAGGVARLEHPGVVVGFRAGVPATLAGEVAGLAGVVAALNRLGGEAGFGRVAMLENRRV